MSTSQFEIDIDYSQAACANVEDPDLFFPDGQANHWDKVSEAKSICLTCPVIKQCFDHGVAHEKLGIWGGHTASELSEYRKAHKINLEVITSDLVPGHEHRNFTGKKPTEE